MLLKRFTRRHGNLGDNVSLAILGNHFSAVTILEDNILL